MADEGADWSEGYVVDIEYIHNYHPGLSPQNIAFACAMQNVRAPDIDRPFTYLDLGCGDGFTPALVAAGNPMAQVWGNDFNPAHVRAAQSTASAGGVDNARFVEASFADLLDADLPQFDMVVAHGVWSWVSGANHDRVAQVLARQLKPGGIAMVSYNCRPGWDALLPLRKLIFTGGGRGGTTVERVERGIAAALRLRDAGAAYFTNTPVATEMLSFLATADRQYVAHEYINEHWTIFEAAEVAAALATVGLTYVGQVRILDDLDSFCLTPAQQALVAEEKDPVARTMLRDLILDRRFRHDLFARDVVTMTDEERDAWLDSHRFALVRPRAECGRVLKAPVGTVTLPEHPFEAALDVLADGAATPADLARAPALAGLTQDELRAVLVYLVACGIVQPALAAAGEPARRASAARFNAAALDGVRMGQSHPALVSPVTGSGIGMGQGDQLLLDAWRVGIPLEAISGSDGTDADPRERFQSKVLPMLERLGIA